MLAAVDPAQPYGAALAWPARTDVRMTRAARRACRAPMSCSRAVSRSLYLERGGRALQTLVEPDDPRLEPALVALVEPVRSGRFKRLALEKVDGEPATRLAARRRRW